MSQIGELNNNYRGDKAGYLAIHVRLRKQKGKAIEHKCTNCDKLAKEWALSTYENLRFDIVSGVRVKFSTNLDDYIPLCVRCHRLMDGNHF